MQDKLQELTDRLYNEGLSKGKHDGEELVQKAQAEADQFRMEQEAIGKKKLAEAAAYEIAQKGQAEAEAIEKKGLAEAEAMNKKAEAYKQYGQAAVLDMMVRIIPEVSKNVAGPIGNIDNLNVYGTSGQDAVGVSGMVPSVIKQSFDVIQSATGVDMTKMVQEKTNLVGAGVDINK